MTGGSAVWNGSTGTLGSWGDGNNWQDAGNAAVHVAPGQFAGFDNVDQAAFSGSGLVTAIDLSTASPTPSLKALTFNNTDYMLSGGSLQLKSDSNMANIVVSSGTQSIGSVLLLASSLDIAPVAGTELTLSGNIHELDADQSLTLSDGGAVILSGTSNSYIGGTYVDQGTLYVQNSGAIYDGTSLTVGAGGTFIFDPMVTGRPLANSSPAVAVAAVPEPGTILLLLVAMVLWSAKACLRFSKRLASRQTRRS